MIKDALQSFRTSKNQNLNLMKNLISTLCLIFLGTAFSLQAQKAVLTAIDNSEVSAIQWDMTSFDFGEINQNEPANATFTLTNRSDQPLILKEVKPSCGCTIADYPQEPIPPGETAKITTTYNAKKTGKFQKTVKVHTNLSEAAIPLTLKGVVIEQ